MACGSWNSCADAGVETHLVVSRTAKVTLATETHFKVADVEALADVVHSNDDLGAACSSGSFGESRS